MPSEWLQTWGELIGPDQLSGSFAARFRNFVTKEAAGLAAITGARRDRPNARAELLILTITTNRPQRPAYPILHKEEVGVLFTTDETFGPVVMALRPDFPDTPHQNWVPEGVPCALCVDDRPWQEARPIYTPAELLHRIIKWFERAGRGGLHDLRQPLDPFFMREGWHVVMPRNAFEVDGGAKQELIGMAHDPSDPKVITLRAPQKHELHGLQHGAFLVITFQIAPQAMSRMRRAPTNLAALVRELAGRGIDLVDELATRITAWSTEAGSSDARFGARLGILLRMPIVGPDGHTTGASDDVAFFTLSTVGEIGIALGRVDKTPAPMNGSAPRYGRLIPPGGIDQKALNGMLLLMAAAHVEFDQKRAVELSAKAFAPPQRIVLIGAGTIGSLVAESLAREGFGRHWTTIDPDFLLPHNLARHDLDMNDVGAPKAVSLANRLHRLRSDVEVNALVADVLKPDNQGEVISVAVRNADLVIDAAASVPVARFVSDHTSTARRASVFFNPAGTAVVLLLESADRNSDLRMLEATYYGDVLRVPALEDHLSQSAEGVPYAGACRAVTNRIPASCAHVLSGLVASGLVGAVTQPNSALCVWSVAPNGAVTVHGSDVGPVTRAETKLGWTVTLPKTLEQKLHEMRRVGLPAETGGVLLGVVDLVKARIDVIEAWSAPSDSTASETEFIRGTKGLRQGVEAAIARTLDQVRYVGEWHSHPRHAYTAPSDTDLLQLGWLAATLSMDGCPGVMLIIGDEDVRINIGAIFDPDEVKA